MSTVPTTVADADAVVSDAKESTTIRFEWTLRGLKNIFESTKGDAKSKVTKSPRFGDGRWQILFYANSGHTGTNGQTFVSLYLACEPTEGEKESSVNGKWQRDGLFDFVFEIRNLSKIVVFNVKEARDHSFHYPGGQNWGWAQFAARDSVYFQQVSVKAQDAFMIVCQITTSPASPLPPPAVPRYLVPRDLLASMGSLLDDPLYSDVEFVLPRQGRTERTIYASRKLLSQRVEYFDAMFNAGFAESAADIEVGLEGSQADDASVSDIGAFAQRFDDSDFEDDDDDEDDEEEESGTLDHVLDVEITDQHDPLTDDEPPETAPTTMTESTSKWTHVGDEDSVEQGAVSATDDIDEDQSGRNTRQKLSHPSSPRSREIAVEQQQAHALSPRPPVKVLSTRTRTEVPGPKKARVFVRDVAYSTYRAVLYYIYTDTITFAPLSSTFTTSTPENVSHDTTALPADTSSLLARSMPTVPPSHASRPAHVSASVPSELRSRKDWILDWERSNFDRPRPASAKSVYRLADKLGLPDLKERAFRHIVKSLTVENVVHEAFSAFSAAFEDVRKVEVSFMFKHWEEVRSGAMASIGQQLRLGRFPGFEEVWPMIIQNLTTEEKEKKADGEGGRT